MTIAVSWPDTRHEDQPAQHPYRSALWLLGRHPQLAALVARVPGVTELEEDGPGLDLEALAAALAEHDAAAAALVAYERRHPRPAR